MSIHKLIGILGGTFDPVHYGHLQTALAIKQVFNLDNVFLIPCAHPVHRRPPEASKQQRLEMLSIAIQGIPEIQIDDCEIKSDGKSYTYDTLKRFRADQPDAHLGLIMGMDAFQQFTGWYRWQDILQLAHLIVVNRPGYKDSLASAEHRLLEQYKSHNLVNFGTQQGGCIFMLELKEYPISATLIRENLKNSLSIEGMMPKKLEKWIRNQKVYTKQNNEEN